MKKILFVFCLVLLLASCGQQAQNQQTQVPAQKDKGVFSSIRDAFDRSLTLRCEYIDEDGQKSINYIKNKMIRTESADTSGQQVYGLFRDDKLYLWGPGSNQGMVFELDALKESNDVEMGGETIHGTDDIINELEQRKDKCSTQSVPDSLFEVPQDVNFTNLNELFNQFNK
jgi:hypothetical protein